MFGLLLTGACESSYTKAKREYQECRGLESVYPSARKSIQILNGPKIPLLMNIFRDHCSAASPESAFYNRKIGQFSKG